MSDLEFTGERVVPSKSPPRLEAEHRARYEFACNQVRGMKVLDIGCGTGYGTYMMSGYAQSVTGVDIDKDAIDHAKENYGATNPSFAVADIRDLPFADGDFDACVCFEVIEHIENPDTLVQQASRVLKPSGMLIVSTPNGAVRTSSQRNPYHVNEFRLGELRELLRESFPSDKWNISIFGQFVKGKAYTKFGVFAMNIYLGLKGLLGIKPKDKSGSAGRGKRKGRPAIEFEFSPEEANLAEYLIAVVRGRA